METTVVDMTRLNLVEITRKKIRKPLHESRCGCLAGKEKGQGFMKIIVGCGKGRNNGAEEIVSRGHDITVIDQNAATGTDDHRKY